MQIVDDSTAILTWPVEVWFNGSRTFEATLDVGGRAISAMTLDPSCRFPDRTPADNVWPKPAEGEPRRDLAGVRSKSTGLSHGENGVARRPRGKQFVSYRSQGFDPELRVTPCPPL